MERRFEIRKRELMKECHVSPAIFAGMMDRLQQFLTPFTAALWRRETKENARTYVAGLLSDLERKNVESIAYRNDQDRRALQQFIGEAPWDYRPLLDELVRQVGAELGQRDAVLVFDPSGFPKKGKHSVGVERQWLGRVGKVDNGQVGVYLAYVSRQEHALVDFRLFLPRTWAGDRRRRKACGVPKPIRFQTRHELALAMLDTDGPHLPHAWIAGDEEMGRSTWFRGALRERNERYLLAVPANTIVRDLEGSALAYGQRGTPRKRPFEQVRHWAATLPESAWTRIDVRDGHKGPLVMDVVKRRVEDKTEGKWIGPEEVLVVTRRPDDNGTLTIDYYVSNAPWDTPLKEFARAAKAEHRVEECLQRAKGEAGLADYEVRTWIGWHHHQTLSLLATWFLVQETRRGKKDDACSDGPSSSRGLGDPPARSFRLCAAKPHRARMHTPITTYRSSKALPLEKA
jgi:SRSO17 transposase